MNDYILSYIESYNNYYVVTLLIIWVQKVSLQFEYTKNCMIQRDNIRVFVNAFKYHSERLCGHFNLGLEPFIPEKTENYHDMCTAPYSPLAIFALTKMRPELILFFTFIFYTHGLYTWVYSIVEFVLLSTFQRYISLIYLYALQRNYEWPTPVSYTHLTLPTIYSV